MAAYVIGLRSDVMLRFSKSSLCFHFILHFKDSQTHILIIAFLCFVILFLGQRLKTSILIVSVLLLSFLRFVFHQNGPAGRRNGLEAEGRCGVHAAASCSGGTDTWRRSEPLVTDRASLKECSVITESIAHQMKSPERDGNLITDDRQQERTAPSLYLQAIPNTPVDCCCFL